MYCKGVLDILTQQPMETLSFLDHPTKRQDINQFDKMLKYHDYIVSHSTAVRLENVNSLDTQALWAHLQHITNTTYCDISYGRTQGTTYIQCFKEKEPEVATAIQSYLLANFSDSADRPIIGERGGGTVNSSSTGTRTYRGIISILGGNWNCRLFWKLSRKSIVKQYNETAWSTMIRIWYDVRQVKITDKQDSKIRK